MRTIFAFAVGLAACTTSSSEQLVAAGDEARDAGDESSIVEAGAPPRDASVPVADANPEDDAAVSFPPADVDCHAIETSTARGAYFRKVRSSAAVDFVTLHAVGTLPTVIIDAERWFHTDDASLAYQNGPLDRPSLYVGGTASDVEVDAGLSWDRVYDTQSRATWTDQLESGSDGGDPTHRFVAVGNAVQDANGLVRAQGLTGLRENFAFRPFWRTSGVWANPAVGAADNVYFYPGDGFRMQLRTAGAQSLELTINDDGSSTPRHLLVTFDAPGWGVGAAQTWKRVHSIDQFTVQDGMRVGLETAQLDVIPTNTRALYTKWTEVQVLDSGGNVLQKLGCNATVVKGADAWFAEHYADVFLIYAQDDDGGETSIIVPPPPN